jgi:flavin reductase (DIM6/NTAB) family NADH-FMN oxidoreductase RutF
MPAPPPSIASVAVNEPETRDLGLEQRELFRRWPAGVSVVVAEADGRRAGLTVSSLASVSLDPPLVSISLAHSASLYEVLREAGEWTVSILSGEQDGIAQHFARSVPPLVLWDGIPVRDDDPRLLADAVGWLHVRTVDELRTGDHTLFVGEVLELERGPGRTSLVYMNRTYTSL